MRTNRVSFLFDFQTSRSASFRVRRRRWLWRRWRRAGRRSCCSTWRWWRVPSENAGAPRSRRRARRRWRRRRRTVAPSAFVRRRPRAHPRPPPRRRQSAGRVRNRKTDLVDNPTTGGGGASMLFWFWFHPLTNHDGVPRTVPNFGTD